MSITQDIEKLKALCVFCKSAGIYLRAEGDRVQISIDESGNHYWFPHTGVIPMIEHCYRMEECVWIPSEDTAKATFMGKEK